MSWRHGHSCTLHIVHGCNCIVLWPTLRAPSNPLLGKWLACIPQKCHSSLLATLASVHFAQQKITRYLLSKIAFSPQVGSGFRSLSENVKWWTLVAWLILVNYTSLCVACKSCVRLSFHLLLQTVRHKNLAWEFCQPLFGSGAVMESLLTSKPNVITYVQ